MSVYKRFSRQRSTDALVWKELLVKLEQLTIPLKHCPPDKKQTTKWLKMIKQIIKNIALEIFKILIHIQNWLIFLTSTTPTPSTLFPYFPPFLPTSFLQKTFSTIQTLNRAVSQFLQCFWKCVNILKRGKIFDNGSNFENELTFQKG